MKISSIITPLPDTATPHVRTAAVEPEAPTGDRRWRVYLAWVPQDSHEKREVLGVMLEKAGMDVFPKEDAPTDEDSFKKKVEEYMLKADCSVHVLGGEFGAVLKGQPTVSWGMYQYEVATLRSRGQGSAFKRLVWTYPLEGMILQGEQQDFILQIQNNLTNDVLVTNTPNAAQFIEDARSFLDRAQQAKAVTKEYDMAFIANVQDAADCYHIIEKLSEDFKLTTLTVVPENDVDYRKQAAEQIRKSRITVVYFKEASDWAISFVKQLWKFVGGASSGVPFLLVGEDEPRRNRFLRFRGPQIQLHVVETAMVMPTVIEAYERVKKLGYLTEEVFSPYTGLRPFNEDESIFFKGRERHIDYIIEMLSRQKFSMVTGSSGDGKSSLVFAGVIPTLKGGFLKTQYSKWAVADFRPERQPLRNLALALTSELRMRDPDEVENSLSYGFSALVDLYKKSTLYCDQTSTEWLDATEEKRRFLKRKAANLLILVDQFEEFFTNIENYRDGVASPLSQITINVLVETIRIAREENLPIYVVTTMRSDYIGQCVAFRGFAEMIGLSTYYVPRLKREEIQEVIQAPAQLNGNKISLRLAQRLLNDLGDGIDQLPVLQHTLREVWTDANRGEQEMDLIHYAIAGGLSPTKLPRDEQEVFEKWFAALPEDKKVLFEKPRLRNVLNRHANELYNTAHEHYNQRYPNAPRMTKELAQDIIRTAFICLTKIDENRAVRNRMSLQQIADIYGKEGVDTQVVGRVLNIFREPGNTFLQPFITDDPETHELSGSAVLDITHESLIRNWERLVDWAERENRSVITYFDFKVQVNRWLANDCASPFLLGAGPYAFFSQWFKEQEPTPAWIRRYFRPDELSADLEPIEQATLYLEDATDFLKDSKARLNRNRNLRFIAIGAILLGLLFSSYSAFQANRERNNALSLKDAAEKSAELAKTESKRAEVQRLKAIQQQKNAELAEAKATKNALEAELQRGFALDEKSKADYQAKLAKQNERIANIQREQAENNAKLAEEQKLLATKSEAEAKTNLQYARDQSEKARLQYINAMILQSLFLSSLATEQADSNHPETGVLLSLSALPVKIGADNERPFVEEAEASLYFSLNKIINSAPRVELRGHKNKMISNRFSADSRLLISTSWDKTARIWDVNSGKQLRTLVGHTNIVDKAVFSSDGTFLVSYGEDFIVRRWDVASGQNQLAYRAHDYPVTDVEISPDNQRIATSSEDQTSRLLDAKEGKEIMILNDHIGPVRNVAFNNTGDRLASCGDDGTIYVYDGFKGTKLLTLKGHIAPVRFITFSPNGALLASVSDDNTARLWDVATGAQLRVLGTGGEGHNGPILHCAFSPDGNRLATAGQDYMVRIWEVGTGKPLGLLKGHRNAVYHVEFSSDSKHICSTSEDRTAHLWDANSYLRLAVFAGHPGLGYFATFSPDAKLLATAGRVNNDITVRIFTLLPNRQELINFAERFRRRELTPKEKQEFFLTDPRLIKETTDTLMRQRQERLRRLNGEGANPTNTPTQAQPIAPQQRVQPSEVMRLQPSAAAQPSHKLHRVVRGETLSAIAQRYSVTVAALRRWNKLTKDEIRAGDMLIILA